MLAVAVAAVLVVAGAGVLVARQSDDDDAVAGGELDDVEGVPVLAGAYRTDGELADGLAIPPGTVLLGDVLLEPFVTAPGRAGSGTPGWRAFLLVVGDMSAVLDDLERQASNLGLESYEEWPYAPGCEATQYVPPEGLVECGRAWTSDTVWLWAVTWRGVVPAGSGSQTDRPVSLLTVELGRLDPGASATTTAPSAPPPTVVAPPATQPLRTLSPATQRELSGPPLGLDTPARTSSLQVLQAPPTTTPDSPLPDDWPAPPGPGERLGHGITPDDGGSVLSLRLPQGAHAVIAPWPTGGNATNYAAIVAVAGDIDSVLADLAAQVHDWFGSDVHEDATEVDGVAVRTVRGDDAGGSKLDLTAVTVNDRAWITVSTSYD
ncbi:MAG: hypothetical protein ACRD2C_17505 [Acidimicrobiales bacterium]